MLANNFFHQPLAWVKPELDTTVKDAKNTLEKLSDNLTNSELLQQLQHELHLLKGSLEILNFDGAALLLEDMQKACSALQNNTTKNAEETYEALIEATLALESYIDKLNKDQTDIPLALLPILNDLRASIEEPLLSENALFLPNLSIVPKTPEIEKGDNDDSCLKDSAKSLRPYYQAALLSWYRNPTDQLSIQQMKLVARNLESTCHTPRNRQIWWILGGLFEALADKGLKSNIAIRLLLGQSDRIIKAYSNNDLTYYEKTPPFNLLKNALYYISQASSNGDRVNSLKQVYQLDKVMPSENDLTQLRAQLKGPNSETLQAIAKELKKTLNQAKATLENFTRNTPDNTDRLKQTLTPLKHVADTLSLLSLGKEKQLLQEQIQAISEIITAKTRPNKDKLMGIAAGIIQVDASLKHIGSPIRKIQEKTPLTPEEEKAMNIEKPKSIGKLPEAEYRFLRSKAVLEAKTNIAQIKNCILSFISSECNNQEALSPVFGLLSEINGCLQILGSTYAANIITALNDCINNELLNKPADKIAIDFDLLAETLVSLDYYLEATSEERVSSEQFLNLAGECLNNLGYKVAQPKRAAKIPTLEAVVTHISEAPTRLKLNANAFAKDLNQSIAKNKEADESNNPNPDKVVEFTPESPDSEVAEIFIEEAQEELDKMATQIKTLRIDPTDRETISNLNRIYHTLKGSGKIAGAIHISDFSSTIEEYLNRVLYGAISLNQEGVTLLSNAYELLHTLIDSFQNRVAPPPEFNAITETAIRLMSPKKLESKIEETQAIAHEEVATEIQSAPVPSTNFLPVNEIKDLLEESFTQIALINRYIEEKTENIDLSPIPDYMQESIDKLHNCAKVTDIKEFIQTTELLSKYMGNLTRKHAPINSETLDILSEFCATTYEILQEIPNRLNARDINIDEYTKIEVELPQEKHVEEIEAVLDNITPDVPETIEVEETAPPEKSIESEIQEMSLALETPAEEQQGVAEEIELDEEDLDLINIFMEEAEELIAKGHNIIEENDLSQPDERLIASIQRLLHTMKGSARMAGASSVGNIAHAFENLAEAIITHQVGHPENFEQLFRDTLDAINDMIDDIRANNDVRLHEDLFKQINSLLHPEETSIQEETPIESADQEETLEEVIPEEPIEGSTTDEEPTAEIDTSDTQQIAAEATIFPIDENIRELESEPHMDSESPGIPSEETPAFEPEAKDLTIEKPTPGETITEEVTIPETRAVTSKPKSEPIKVSPELIDTIVDQANTEGSINNRLEDHIATIKTNLLELDKAISRSLNQMRDLQFNTSRQQEMLQRESSDSNLNLNQFSDSQKTALRMMESIGDIENLHSVITKLTLETDNLLQQQKKTHSAMYESLLDTRLVNFSIQTQRIQRIVRQTTQALGKKAELHMEGTEGSIDRVLLESIMGSLEHIIRNAIAHGIELPADRIEKNKNENGQISIRFRKEESQHIIEIQDDGAGMNPETIRQKALEKGLIEENTQLTDDQILQLIFEPGFSTSKTVDQIAGRGVGMNVVLNDIEALGGHVTIESKPGVGSTFIIQLPFTVSRNKTLLVSANNNIYAIPTNAVVQTIPVSQAKLEALYKEPNPIYEFEERDYPLWYIDSLLNKQATTLPSKYQNAYLLIIKYKHKRLALQVDQINEARDSVLKPSSPQLAGVKGLAGTTILGNGKVVLILDIPSLFKLADESENGPGQIIYPTNNASDKQSISALIVDDSITVRKVSERFLNRNNITTESARDGLEALDVLKEYTPDVILLDIEMPNMDGLELAKRVKTNPQLGHIPIIMITSRTGQQHRQAASEIGVDVFLGKPYQESELLGYIQALTGKRLRNG